MTFSGVRTSLGRVRLALELSGWTDTVRADLVRHDPAALFAQARCTSSAFSALSLPLGAVFAIVSKFGC
jgi:hypothetical protein